MTIRNGKVVDPAADIAAKQKEQPIHARVVNTSSAPDWDRSDVLRAADFGQLCTDRQMWKDAEDKAIKARKDCDAQIESYLLIAEQRRVLWSGVVVEVVISHSASRISATKLVDAGVDPDLVVSCTEAGREYSYIKIGKGDGNGNSK